MACRLQDQDWTKKNCGKIWTLFSGMARFLDGWNSDSDFEDAEHQQGVTSLLLLIHLTFAL